MTSTTSSTTAGVLTRYPLDAHASRRRRRRIAAVVAVRREQSARSAAGARPVATAPGSHAVPFDHAG